MAKICWNTHALLTHHSLIRIDDAVLRERIPVVCLEEFLIRAAGRLGDLFERYRNLFSNQELRGACLNELGSVLGLPEFCLASGLHPDYQMSYVKLAGRPEELRGSMHNPSRLGPPRQEYVDVKDHDAMSVLEIVCAYSDEPDWGMDQGLFSIPVYNYGSAPLGQSDGDISQGVFHTNFLHENIIVAKLFPQIRVNFMTQRIRLFEALSGLAFDLKVDYWGWRFLAWAMHYLQDITQPYHARVCPLPTRFVLTLLLKRMSPFEAIRENMYIVVNRHMVYERFVHYVLNKRGKLISADPTARALCTIHQPFSGRLPSVIYDASYTPARLAPMVDRALRETFAVKYLDDPCYRLDSEEFEFNMDILVPIAYRDRSEALRRLLDLTCACFRHTGEATRYMIRKSARRQGEMRCS